MREGVRREAAMVKNAVTSAEASGPEGDGRGHSDGPGRKQDMQPGDDVQARRQKHGGCHMGIKGGQVLWRARRELRVRRGRPGRGTLEEDWLLPEEGLLDAFIARMKKTKAVTLGQVWRFGKGGLLKACHVGLHLNMLLQEYQLKMP